MGKEDPHVGARRLADGLRSVPRVTLVQKVDVNGGEIISDGLRSQWAGAKKNIQQSAELVPDAECWIDTPNVNAAATALMEEVGATGAPTSGRMVRGEAPIADTSVMFGLLAHEVG